jgi:hypothetical protein
MTMTQDAASAANPVQVLARVLMDATEAHGELHAKLMDHVNEVADTVMSAIRGNTEQGAALRAELGVEVTTTTRTGKHVRAAMDAYTSTSHTDG